MANLLHYIQEHFVSEKSYKGKSLDLLNFVRNNNQ